MAYIVFTEVALMSELQQVYCYGPQSMVMDKGNLIAGLLFFVSQPIGGTPNYF
jgi:hypothetical protein